MRREQSEPCLSQRVQSALHVHPDTSCANTTDDEDGVKITVSDEARYEASLGQARKRQEVPGFEPCILTFLDNLKFTTLMLLVYIRDFRTFQTPNGNVQSYVS